ncbi:MAG TPA: hypothetical protein VGD37_11860 [Kofleriaceae bacterium]|jgi:hypothetical protein
MPPTTHRVAAALAAAAASLGATVACRLDPLVDDKPGASASILPSNAAIPSVADDPDLLNQITLNDGLDPSALDASGGVIPRGTGFSNGDLVHFWAFGAADRAPAPIYLLGTGDAAAAFTPLTTHLPLVDAVPGDSEYNPIHTIYRVVVTAAYHDQKITTTAALADAIQLGLVSAPVAIKTFVDSPIVRPGTRIEVATGVTAMPTQVYAHGHIADTYQFGGALGLQANPFGLLPTKQVSFLRTSNSVGYDTTRPIFQATIPTAAPKTMTTYTPLSVVVDVDLSITAADNLKKDGDLFGRSAATGAITSTVSPPVAAFTVTSTLLVLQLQFAEGLL